MIMNEAIEDFNGAVEGLRNLRLTYKREGMTDDAGAPWAMYRLFEIIERALKNIPDDLKEENFQIPWAILSKPRHNFIIEFRRHDDDILDIDKMWEISAEVVQADSI